MLDHELEAHAWNSLGRGVYKGTARSLKKLDDFLMRLGHEPKATLGQMANDYKAIGNCIVSGLLELGEFNPAMCLDDAVRDLIDDFKHENNWDETNRPKSRVQLRHERNKKSLEHGYTATINAAQNVVLNMLENSLEDNIAGLTEFGVDSLITAKMTDSFINVSQLVGSSLIEAGRDILEVIPKNLLDSPVNFMTNGAGELVAIAEVSGENIGAAVAAAGKSLLDPLEKGIHCAAQANNAANKRGGFNRGGGKPSVEPAKGSPEYAKKYPNGKYKPSKKHHENSPDDIGKPPRDGQAALDNSFEVKESSQRVVVQDGKVVILKFEEDGIYHGYIVQDYHSLTSDNVKNALVKNGLVNSFKGGKVIK